MNNKKIALGLVGLGVAAYLAQSTLLIRTIEISQHVKLLNTHI